MFRHFTTLLAPVAALSLGLVTGAMAGPDEWRAEFPRTDFSKRNIEFSEIITDGPKRDEIPPIHEPAFVAADKVADIGPFEPVLSIAIQGDARAYPLRILLWHEIVNDTVGGVPVLVSYCPLCNSGVVFDRRLDGEVLRFGNTGRIRHFDMVMYDQQTESWWQQFLGKAIVGKLSGRTLKLLPARLESLGKFRARWPKGKVLIPGDKNARPYGSTPYVQMDTAKMSPRRFPYKLPSGVRPMERVVVVGGEAWTLDILQSKKKIESGEIVIRWEPGQNSIHDTRFIPYGRDVGNVIVQKQTAKGLEDIPYDVAFAFAFKAFLPDGILHH